jgi:hypothetical protein
VVHIGLGVLVGVQLTVVAARELDAPAWSLPPAELQRVQTLPVERVASQHQDGRLVLTLHDELRCSGPRRTASRRRHAGSPSPSDETRGEQPDGADGEGLPRPFGRTREETDMSDEPIPGGQRLEACQMMQETGGDGVTRPVILHYSGPGGLPIAAALGRPPGLAEQGDDPYAPGRLLPAARAAALLRAHCGGGGEAAAQRLEDGVFRYRQRGLVLDPPICVIRFPPKSGDTRPDKLVSDNTRDDVKAFVHRERITVPAGRYETVVVAREFPSITGPRLGVTYWFAPDIGPVKIVLSIGTDTLVCELTSFRPGP